MDVELLGKCIETLKELRAQTRETMEVSVCEELDEVIHQLEMLREVGDEGRVEVDAGLRVRVIEIIAHVLKVTTNLSEIIKHFLNAT